MKPGENENKDPPTFKKPPSTNLNSNPIPQPELGETVILPVPQTKFSDVLPPKKRRKKKTKSSHEDNGQSKIDKHQITKPRAIKDITKVHKFELPKRPKGDQSPERLLNDAVAKKRAAIAIDELAELGLETTMRRRVDWTPVRDTIALAPDISCEGIDLASTETPNTALKPNATFGNLSGHYGFSDQGVTSAPSANVVHITPSGLSIKKRRIDLVNKTPSAASIGEKVKKVKSIQKKLQTITAKATEDFVKQVEGNDVRTVADYLIPPPQDPFVKEVKQICARTKNAKAKTKAVAESAPVVLSPETAMKATDKQSFVFGTSSQLVREESPTDIGGYQQAVMESGIEDTSFKQAVQHSSLNRRVSQSLGLSPSRNLWSAAAGQDKAGFVNLADTPKAETPKESVIPDEDAVIEGTSTSNPQDVWQDVAEISSPVAQPNDDSQTNRETPQEEPEQPLPRSIAEKEPEQSLPRSVAEKALKSRPRSTSSKKKVLNPDPSSDRMPNYQGFADAQLKIAIKAYGFKAIKKREAMISLLEKCWENQQSHVLQEVTSNALMSNPNQDLPSRQATKSTGLGETRPSNLAKAQGGSSKPTALGDVQDKPTKTQSKRPRGRPKKDLSATTPPPAKRKRKISAKDMSETMKVDTGDEIYDSSPPTPSPPRRRTPSEPAKSLTLSPSGSSRTKLKTLVDPPATNKISSENRKRLFAAITQAVTSQKPTQDPMNPSWHERVLIYEPIVIEDLTRWLNAEGLATIDEDDEVDTMLVKEWCESQSICCLWKENLRGLPRARW